MILIADPKLWVWPGGILSQFCERFLRKHKKMDTPIGLASVIKNKLSNVKGFCSLSGEVFSP
jgi:hypothetical protein